MIHTVRENTNKQKWIQTMSCKASRVNAQHCGNVHFEHLLFNNVHFPEKYLEVVIMLLCKCYLNVIFPSHFVKYIFDVCPSLLPQPMRLFWNAIGIFHGKQLDLSLSTGVTDNMNNGPVFCFPVSHGSVTVCLIQGLTNRTNEVVCIHCSRITVLYNYFIKSKWYPLKLAHNEVVRDVINYTCVFPGMTRLPWKGRKVWQWSMFESSKWQPLIKKNTLAKI